MKKLIFFFLTFLFIQTEISAQIVNNLVVFSNEGEKFTLILNGERRNINPETNLKVTGLNLATYKVRVIFENKDLEDLETTLNFFSTNYECVFGLMKKSRRKHTMDYVSQTEINPVPVQDQPKEDNNTNTNTYTNTNTHNNTNSNTNTNSNSNSNSTYTPTKNTSNNSSSNVSLNNGNFGVGVNNNGGVSIKTKEGSVNLGSHNETTAVINVLGNAISMHKAAEKTGCASPMLQTQFEIAKKNVTEAASDSGKVKASNQLIQSNCLLTAQVQEILDLLSNDQTKLEFAMKAYSHTSDLNNYYKLKNSFTSEAYKKDFHTYVESKK
jgi:hypothetical protein